MCGVSVCLQTPLSFCRPVIESQEFYKLFPALKRQLDRQKLTHNTAGEFLHVMKTLMAKLKVRFSHHTFYEGIDSNIRRQMIGALSHVRIPRSRNRTVQLTNDALQKRWLHIGRSFFHSCCLTLWHLDYKRLILVRNP